MDGLNGQRIRYFVWEILFKNLSINSRRDVRIINKKLRMLDEILSYKIF